jgi:hypothetical protein
MDAPDRWAEMLLLAERYRDAESFGSWAVVAKEWKSVEKAAKTWREAGEALDAALANLGETARTLRWDVSVTPIGASLWTTIENRIPGFPACLPFADPSMETFAAIARNLAETEFAKTKGDGKRKGNRFDDAQETSLIFRLGQCLGCGQDGGPEWDHARIIGAEIHEWSLGPSRSDFRTNPRSWGRKPLARIKTNLCAE